MRKYNNKMKKTLMIIIGLFVVIVVIFSLFLKKAIEVDKTAYDVSSGSILFDNDKNMITTDSSGVIRIKWGGDYYFTYKEENYNLGSHSVVYDVDSGDIKLYGKFYEVLKDGKVETTKGENILKSSVNSKFYKLADRKYLIIDRVIESGDSSFSTGNYLMIHLDKLGNAMLLNNRTSYKTIEPTVLKTSSFVFDIANEKLNFGEEDIDLKKIIGSTNEYDEDKYDLNADKEEEEGEGENSDVEGDGTGTGTGTGSGSGSGNGSGNGSGGGAGGDGTGGSGGGAGGIGGEGTGTGNGSGIGIGGGSGGGAGGAGGTGTGTGTNIDGTTAGNSSGVNNNYSPGVSDSVVSEIINAARNTSVIRVTGGISDINIDYVVYDPLDEYKSVYVEVESDVSINTVYLSKTDTNLVLRDLMPNTYYNLVFKYTYTDNDGILKEYEFDEVGLFTKMPSMYMSAVKLSNNKFYYKITMDGSYTVSAGLVKLYKINNNEGLDDTGIEDSISSMGIVSQIYGNDCYVDLSTLNLKKGDVLEVKLDTLEFNGITIRPGVSYRFMY